LVGLSGSYDEINVSGDVTATVLLGDFHAVCVESAFQGDVYLVVRSGQRATCLKDDSIGVGGEVVHRQVLHRLSR
jgi:hypothetical protein